MLVWKDFGELSHAADLLLVSKLPVPGRVKTRLADSIGPEAASMLAAAMLGDQLQGFGSVEGNRVLCGDQPDATSFSDWFLDPEIEPFGWNYRCQGEGDLGARLSRCCLTSFQEGRQAVVLVGADAPRYSTQQIEKALACAISGMATLGPAGDGGYGLIAIPERSGSQLRDLFPARGWGAEGVADRALDQLRKQEVPVQLLPVLDDIDDERDLTLLWQEMQQNGQMATRLWRTHQQLLILQKEGWSGTR